MPPLLSSILQVVGNLAALLFLRRFPAILRKRGWFGVHAILAALGVVACVAMGAIMFDTMLISEARLATGPAGAPSG